VCDYIAAAKNPCDTAMMAHPNGKGAMAWQFNI